MQSLSAAVAALPLLATLAACAPTASAESETVRLGVVGASEPYWETYVAEAKDEGITVELIDFSDYAQPNPALTNKEIDLNQFQHIVYLADYNANSNQDLTPICATAI